MSEWKEYTGSDEQIADLEKAKNGIIAKNKYGHIWDEIYLLWDHAPIGSTHYWIIPADPLREMKIRQSMTGQPVWIKLPRDAFFDNTYPGKVGDTANLKKNLFEIVTTKPDWNIPKAEYSFTPFQG